MKGKLLYALLGAAVCAAAAFAVSGAVQLSTKRDKDLRRLAEKYVLAPGRIVADKVEGSKVRRAAEEGLEKLTDLKAVQELKDSRAADRLGELAHYYNVGVFTLLGFLLCLLMALVLGVSSVLDAIALGFKVTLTLFFLQVALVIFVVTQGSRLL